MSDNISAILLGIVQGLTEFLPVSSSGHIEIAESLFGSGIDPQKTMLMTVVLHFATALSTVVVFRQEIVQIARGLVGSLRSRKPFSRRNYPDLWFCINIVISMIPAVAVGLLLEDQIEALFDGKLLLVGCMLVITGLLLLLADRARATEKQVGWFEAIVIGISQAIAILPGISRSGATISTSVLLGVDRSNAARFSFLMVVPLIFGKMGYDVLKAAMGKQDPDTTLYSGEWLPLLLGFVAAFVTGWLACTWMIKLVKACQLSWFAYYCFAVAAIVIAFQLAS